MQTRFFRIIVSLLLFSFFLLEVSAYANPLVFEKDLTQNGNILLTKSSSQLPLVTIRISLHAGSKYEKKELSGLANITALTLARGTKKRDALTIEKLNDELGGGVSFKTGHNFVTVSAKFLKRDLDKGFELLGDLLNNPIFPKNEIRKNKIRLYGKEKKRQFSPNYIAKKSFLSSLYGDHPYGRLIEGGSKTIKRIQRKDIVNFYTKHYKKNDTVFVFVGDINKEKAQKLMKKFFSKWNTNRLNIFPNILSPLGNETKKKSIHKPFSQTTVLMGNRSIKRTDPNFYAARVMNYILGGGGFESRIMKNLREKRGLVYSVYSYFASGIENGYWFLALQTKNENAELAVSETLSEIKKIKTYGVTIQELNDAKSYLTGSFKTKFDSSGRIADYILAIQRLGFSKDYPKLYLKKIKSVTLKQVKNAAINYIKKNHFIITEVGNKRGKVQE
ncbi:MAG: pitrilysin family protein [Nitrospinota bacterium]|nr:pitrilysin family protein [Nitrospinota bacterium]